MHDDLSNPLSKLAYFLPQTLKLNRSASPEAITKLEASLGLEFPAEMTHVLRQHNGGRVCTFEFYGATELHGTRQIPSDLDILKQTQRFLRMEVSGLDEYWPKSWIQIGRDGFGNLYVIDKHDVAGKSSVPILFVDHETIGTADAASMFASSYYEFLALAIDEMMEAWLPDGNLKRVKR
jgi:cell wall assembly regulator SMI1